MAFWQLKPSATLANLVECFWVVDSNDPEPRDQKIIPDGFSEIILHFGDPYMINLGNGWQRQDHALIAGQIRRYFYLRNTGRSRIVAIKFRPAALTHLWGLRMADLTDRVEPLDNFTHSHGVAIQAIAGRQFEPELIIARWTQYLEDFIARMRPRNGQIDRAIDLILSSRGMITTGTLARETGTGERQLERLFARYIGLSPKFYARIIRFSRIFELVDQKKNWLDIVEQAGFYDQPHFIKNFREFTGEDPSNYSFQDVNLANFFLMRRPGPGVGFVQ